jgi:hypothetical protein
MNNLKMKKNEKSVKSENVSVFAVETLKKSQMNEKNSYISII